MTAQHLTGKGNIGCHCRDKFLITSDYCEYNTIFLNIKVSMEGRYSSKKKIVLKL